MIRCSAKQEESSWGPLFPEGIAPVTTWYSQFSWSNKQAKRHSDMAGGVHDLMYIGSWCLQRSFLIADYSNRSRHRLNYVRQLKQQLWMTTTLMMHATQQKVIAEFKTVYRVAANLSNIQSLRKRNGEQKSQLWRTPISRSTSKSIASNICKQ